MQTTDVNNNKDGRITQIDDANPKPADQTQPKLPANKRFGNNEQGYAILPDEGK